MTSRNIENRILEALCAAEVNGTSCTRAMLAAALELSHAELDTILAQLQHGGYLSTILDEKDTPIVLTAFGRMVC